MNFNSLHYLFSKLSLKLPSKKKNPTIHKDDLFFQRPGDGLNYNFLKYLVGKKVPFREAYQIVGDIVKYCLTKDILFKDLKLEEFQIFHSEFKEDIFENLNPVNVVKSRNSLGGSGFDQVKLELQNWKNKLFFNRWRPQNETYLHGFRKHEQGNNAKEIPQFDPLIANKDKNIQKIALSLSAK